MTSSVKTKITCEERDAHWNSEWDVMETLTDPIGRYGRPKILTVWGFMEMRVKDVRWPSRKLGDRDLAPCEHYWWIETEGEDD